MKSRNNIKKIVILTLVLSILFSIFNISVASANEPLFMLENALIEDKSTGVEASILDFNDEELITDVTFHKVNDFVLYKLTIKNTSNLKYKIRLINDNNNSSNVFYEYTYDHDQYLQPNDTIDVALKSIYKTEVEDMSKRDQGDEVLVTFVIEDEEGHIIEQNIHINPSTFDNIMFYVYTLVISIIFLILIYIRNKKIKKALVIALLITPVIAKAIRPSLTISLINNTKLYDKIVVNNIVNGEEVTEIVAYNSIPEKPEDPEIDGYEFIGWYVGDEEYNFDEPLKEDSVIEAKFKLIEYDLVYDLDGGDADNPLKYTVETETFELEKPEKGGYTFSGWTEYEGDTLKPTVVIAKGSTGNRTFKANYSTNQDTPYLVRHIYEGVNGEEDEVVEVTDTGATDTVVEAAVRPRTGFETPEAQNVKILGTELATVEYTYTRKTYLLTLTNSDFIETNFESGKYYSYETLITLKAKAREHYTFTKWSDESTNETLSFQITANTEIGPIYDPVKYNISFNANGGVEVQTVQREYNTEFGKVPETSYPTYIFDGWYEDLDDESTLLTSTTVTTGEKTYTAKWIKSVSLAEISNENVVLTRGESETITLTNVDETYTFESSNPAIATVNSSGLVTAAAKGTTTITIQGDRSENKRTINVTVNPKMITVEFDENGGSAVVDPTVEEFTTLESIPETELEHYIFDGWFTDVNDEGTLLTLETTIDDAVTYHAKWLKSIDLANISNENIELTRTQTETITITNVDESYEIVSNDENVATVVNGVVTATGKGTTTLTVTGNNSERTRTINVTVNPIMYNVTFDEGNGSEVQDMSIEENTTLQSIPNTELEHYIFDGWYEDVTDASTKLTTSTVIDSAKAYTAKWLKSVDLANISNENIELTREGTEIVTITNVDEDYTIVSNDESIATVNANGLVTGVAKGTTTITITGTKSERTRTINVTVNPKMFDVTFDEANGSTVQDLSVEENTTLQSIPETEQDGYIFDGWYTNINDASTKLTLETVIDGPKAYVAKWLKSIKVANISNENVTLTRTGTETITITNVDEAYSIVSNEPTIASIDNNGLITALAKGTTTITITGLSSQETRTINVTVNPIMYNVTFDEGNGSEVQDMSIEENTTLQSIPNTELEHYIFDGWYEDVTDASTKLTTSTVIDSAKAYTAKWLKSVDLANISNENVELTRTQTETITITNVDETYTIESNNTSIATIENGVITAVGKGTTTITITGDKSERTRTINVTVNPIMYNVTFNENGGSEVQDLSVEENTTIENIPESEIEGNIFDGWFEDITDASTKLTTSTVIDSAKAYTAKFVKTVNVANISNENVVLTRTQTETITITNVDEAYTIVSNNPAVATIDNDGLITAVGKGTTTITITGLRSEDTRTINVTINPIMYNVSFNENGGSEVQDLSVEENTTIENIPESEIEGNIFDGWFEDLTDASTKLTQETVINSTKVYNAKFVKTVTIANISNTDVTLTRTQTETITITNVDETYSIASGNSNIATMDNDGVITAVGKGTTTITITGDRSGETRTINVTVNPIMYNVTFDENGGSDVQDLSVEENTTIENIPETEIAGNIFDGWFEDITDASTLLTDQTVIDSAKAYTAKWTRTVEIATLNKTSIGLARLGTDTIVVSGVDENYTFTSSDPNTVSVDQNGLVTGLQQGTAVITITGERSHKTKTVNVTVSPIMYNVTFDENGGSEVQDLSVVENSSLESIPTSDNGDYVLDGWYLNVNDPSTLLTLETVIDGDKAYHAKWVNSLTLATISNENIVLTREGTETITVTNVGETYSFESANASIATVNAQGLVTAVAKGSTTITITGDKSGRTRTVNVTVNPKMVTVTFDEAGGSAVVDPTVEEFTTLETIPNTELADYIFDGWYTNINDASTKLTTSTSIDDNVTYHAKWLKSVTLANISNENVTLTRTQTETITISNVDEAYSIVSNNPAIATIDNNGLITAVAKGTTTITITGLRSEDTRTINVTVNPIMYNVTFDEGDGSAVQDLSVEENTTLQSIPETEQDGYIFDGWYEDVTDASTKLTTSTVIDSAKAYTAKWLKSVKLANISNTDVTLTRTQTTTVTITNVDEAYSIASGNSNIATMDNNGLITAVGKGTTTITITGLRSEETKTINVTVNPIMYNVTFDEGNGSAVQDLSIEENTTIANIPNTTLNDYVFDGWYEDVTDASTKLTTSTVIDSAKAYTAKWLKSVTLANISNENVTLTRTNTETITITNVDEPYTVVSNDTSIATYSNGVITGVAKGSTTITITGDRSEATRTINVTVNPIMYSVTFDEGAGSTVQDLSVEENTTITNIPTTTLNDYVFDGWYEDVTDASTKLTDQTVIDSAKAYTAKWLKSVTLANISNTNVTLTRTNTETITITNVDEPYTVVSNDTTIATYSNGTITGVAKGSTTITITGDRSHETRTINVTVNPIMYSVTFDEGNGSSVQDLSIEENTTISTIPQTSLTDYIFDGWYEDVTDASTLLTTSTVIDSAKAYTAKWLKSITLANITSTNVTLTRTQSTSIGITNVDETYTAVSNNPSIATYTNGVITAQAKGTTTITITGDRSHETRTINVTVNPIMYSVTFDEGAGSTVQDLSIEENTTITNIPQTSLAGYYFDGWYIDVTDASTLLTTSTVINSAKAYIAKWVPTIANATISNTNVTLDVGDTEPITITGPAGMENYTISSSDDTVATMSNGVISGLSEGTATITLTGAKSSATRIISVTVTSSVGGPYTISFDSAGGSSVSNTTRNENEVLGTLSIPTKTGYVFDGWYDNNNQKVNGLMIVTSNIHLTAHWTEAFCKIATQLHKETCERTDSNGCKAAGYQNGAEIKYGSLVDSNVLDYGDAFDCDINNDGIYDEDTERFYYIGNNGNNGVFLFYNNISTTTTGTDDNIVETATPMCDSPGVKYSPAHEQLPTTRSWSGITQTFDGKAARFVSFSELQTICSSTSPISGDCEYILENTEFYHETNCTNTYWAQKYSSQNAYRVLGKEHLIGTRGLTQSNNAPRPVIEVPLNLVEKGPSAQTYLISFDSTGGSDVEAKEIGKDDVVGTLPTPTRAGYVFSGWYTDNTSYTTRITGDEVVTADATYYAKWIENDATFPYVFYQEGACEFNKSNNIGGYECGRFVNSNYIDTEVSLYDSTNHDLDYEIGFEIVSFEFDNDTNATLVNTKKEATGYPGVVVRKKENSTTTYVLQSRSTSNANTQKDITMSGTTSIKIYRISGVIYYSVNGGERTEVNNLSSYNPIFDLTVWFGAAPTDATATGQQRHLHGTLKNMYIKLGTFPSS